MDKFFIREIAAVWAFDKNNEAVWKCSNVSKLKILQDGDVIRKKDSQGMTIFKMDTAKSATISFEVSYWDFNIISMISGAEKREIDNTQNPYLINPIAIPYAQSRKVTASNIASGYIELDKKPRRNKYGYYEVSAYKTNGTDSILVSYQQGIEPDDKHFRVQDNHLMLPTSVTEGDNIEVVYEYDSYCGTELINTAKSVPETWKVRILMLVSPLCNTDIVSAVWITANNASPETKLSLDLNVEDNIPVSLELGYSICDENKKLYEIVSAGVETDGVELRTYDEQVLYSHDDEAVKTIR